MIVRDTGVFHINKRFSADTFIFTKNYKAFFFFIYSTNINSLLVCPSILMSEEFNVIQKIHLPGPCSADSLGKLHIMTNSFVSVVRYTYTLKSKGPMIT